MIPYETMVREKPQLIIHCHNQTAEWNEFFSDLVNHPDRDRIIFTFTEKAKELVNNGDSYLATISRLASTKFIELFLSHSQSK